MDLVWFCASVTEALAARTSRYDEAASPSNSNFRLALLAVAEADGSSADTAATVDSGLLLGDESDAAEAEDGDALGEEEAFDTYTTV